MDSSMTSPRVPRRRVRIREALGAMLAVAAVAGPGVAVSGQASGATPVQGPAVLSEVRIGNDGMFDRVVFEFLGDVVPQATLGGPKANTPGAVTTDPGDQPVSLTGSQVLTVAMTPAIATYAASDPTDPLYSGPTSFSPGDTANVVQVVEIGDFESVLSWAISYRSAVTPTVRVLTRPTRVVVDIPHATAVAAGAVNQSPDLTG